MNDVYHEDSLSLTGRADRLVCDRCFVVVSNCVATDCTFVECIVHFDARSHFDGCVFVRSTVALDHSVAMEVNK